MGAGLSYKGGVTPSAYRGRNAVATMPGRMMPDRTMPGRSMPGRTMPGQTMPAQHPSGPMAAAATRPVTGPMAPAARTTAPLPRTGRPAMPGVVLAAIGIGAVAVLGLWWKGTPSVSGLGGLVPNAGRRIGLLAGY